MKKEEIKKNDADSSKKALPKSIFIKAKENANSEETLLFIKHNKAFKSLFKNR